MNLTLTKSYEREMRRLADQHHLLVRKPLPADHVYTDTGWQLVKTRVRPLPPRHNVPSILKPVVQSVCAELVLKLRIELTTKLGQFSEITTPTFYMHPDGIYMRLALLRKPESKES